MKKHLFIFLLFFTSISFYSQDNSDKKIVFGGSLNLSTDNFNSEQNAANTGTAIYLNSSKWTRFSINPYIGYEVSPQVLLGIGFGFEQQTTSQSSTPPNSSTQSYNLVNNGYSFMVFSRFLLNPENDFKFYLSPQVSYFFGNDQHLVSSILVDTSIKDNEISSFFGGIDFGFLYKLGDKYNLLVDAGSVYYNKGTRKAKGREHTTKFDSFQFDFKLSNITFGIERKF